VDELPIVYIIVTFAAFMTIVLAVYFWLLNKELKAEQESKKSHLLEATEEKNDYNEKFNFLERQQVSVSTI
jgi:hypothetical protein